MQTLTVLLDAHGPEIHYAFALGPGMEAFSRLGNVGRIVTSSTKGKNLDIFNFNNFYALKSIHTIS